MISKVKIFGERCSGTNYLENLIVENFKVEYICNNNIFGQKHFFGFHSLEHSEDTLFICIIRHYHSFLNSLWKDKWHISPLQRRKKEYFLYSQHWSYMDKKEYSVKDFGKEIMEDRHIYTKKRYKNILELRYIKLKWMKETLPKKVKHCIIIRYEDLIDNFNETMDRLHKKGLPLLFPSSFPKNYYHYKKNPKKLFIPEKKNDIEKEEIENHPFFQSSIEKELGYLL